MGLSAKFKQFFSTLRSGFKRIVQASQGEATVEDLESEAWILTTELESKNNIQLDLTDTNLQTKILARLYNRHIKGYGSQSVRHTISIDKTYLNAQGEEQENYIFAQLTTLATDEPDGILGRFEKENEQETKIAARFSEIIAYVRILEQLCTYRAVTEHLSVCTSTLHRKIHNAKEVSKKQASLFDGITIIPANFIPPRSLSKYRKYRSAVKIHSSGNFSTSLL